MSDLSNQAVVVTGSVGNLGAAVIRAFRAQNAKITLEPIRKL